MKVESIMVMTTDVLTDVVAYRKCFSVENVTDKINGKRLKSGSTI